MYSSPNGPERLRGDFKYPNISLPAKSCRIKSKATKREKKLADTKKYLKLKIPLSIKNLIIK